MKTILKTIFCFLALATTLSACYYDEIAGFEGLPANASFKNDVSPILVNNCTAAGCHDAQGSHKPILVAESAYNELIQGNYLNTIEPAKSHLYVELNSGMPPAGPLSVNEMKIILGWITDGAKNN